MTAGKWVVLGLLAVAVLAGAGLWYAQTRAWYAPVDRADITFSAPDGTAMARDLLRFEGIDASTSPLRYRACFEMPGAEVAPLIAAGMIYEAPEPLIAPGWFDCYDAETIARALENDEATAILGARNIATGVDRVIALFPDGRGFAWHQLNGTLE
ncbi:Pyruvate carboxylase [Roseibacterium elongatum DSM 19469]|uniref:Pyruvate carboxylase n=1 Tax=Roseicyclus elongatus DSM 19469 TaxID=1294273 RepID=W8S602_9RHOB|nr:DUF6446 family protein [Roseibacterium elongatum]AHM05672.1 Pyruvate carboxylase [Roseibacterium elongatum DSM 19469]